MDNKSLGWISLVFLLFLSTFGLVWCSTLALCLLTFVFGLMSLLYIQQGDVDRFYRNCVGNPLTYDSVTEGGLDRVVKPLTQPKKVQKTDNRVTGSELIDSSLQEILFYIIRDYVTPWYHLISLDEDFPQVTVRKTAQNLAINISNRVKEVDWIPYLTTRLVDDAASHLRLFKQARAKMKQDSKEKSPRSSPRRELRTSSPKRSHKRNKSETDIAWYFGSRNVSEKKGETDRNTANSRFYLSENKPKNTSLEDYFFDLECQMENNTVCRDLICTSGKHEREFLSELVELLLYILLPDEDFSCKPLRFILRELFSNCVILPVFTMISDPDYINQAIIWLCLRDISLPSEIFLTTLRVTDSCDELRYTKEIVSKEVQLLRSRDSGGESDLSIKQQLSSLYYVLKLIDNRLTKLDNFEQVDYSIDYLHLDTMKKIDLPLDIVLRNNVALSYFIDFVSSQNLQHYLFFYLNIDAWRASVKQQLQSVHQKSKGSSESSLYENIRSTALSIYDQYLKERSENKIEVDHHLLHKLFFKIKSPTEVPSECWFDDIANSVYEKMENQEEFLPAFKCSRAYLKLLQELELINQHQVEEDALSLNSLETLEDVSSEEHKSNTNSSEKHIHESSSAKNLKFINSDFLTVASCEKNIKHVRSLSDVTDCIKASDKDFESSQINTKHSHGTNVKSANSYSTSSNTNFNVTNNKATNSNTTNTYTTNTNNTNRNTTNANTINIHSMNTNTTNSNTNTNFTSSEITSSITANSHNKRADFEILEESLQQEKDLKTGDYVLSVHFIETGIVCDKGKTFGIYAIQVTRQYDSGSLEQWHIYRRYSDFYDLHSKVKDKYPDLSKIAFPGKKTFHNMERSVLERRMKMLGSYMHELCQSHVINSHHGLRDLLMGFLEQGEYDRATSGGPISHTIDTIVNPLKSGMKTIKNMPEQLINTVDEVVDSFNKVFHSKSTRTQEASKVGAGLDVESDDNIPLRIILLLMDEVFDLKSRNQWLRRRIVTLLRQIVRTMFGDIVNRRILDYVSFITSPKNVAHYLHIFKQSFWPNGMKAETKPQRDESTKFRTRVAAKVALLSCLSDELKHIIGSETTRKGLLTVFEIFQRPTLNRRLLYVLLEGVLCNMFPEKNMAEIFQKLHSKSKRFQSKQKELSSHTNR